METLQRKKRSCFPKTYQELYRLKYFSPAQAAVYLQTTVSYLAYLRHADQGPAHKKQRHYVLYSREALEAWIDKEGALDEVQKTSYAVTLEPGATPEKLAIAVDLRRQCHRVLVTLNKRHQTVLRLRFWEDLTLADIAEKLDLTTERVRQIENRALRLVRHASRSKVFCERLWPQPKPQPTDSFSQL